MRSITRSTVSGLRANSPPVSPNGEASTRSQASSTSRTRSTASSGPKISSCSTGESSGSSVASAGTANQPVVGDRLGGGGEPAGRLRLGGVARDALLRLALDHRRDVDVQPLGLPDLEHGDRAGEPLDQRVVDRLVAEHAGGGGALLAGVDERGLHERGDDLVEVGVGVDDHAVLAAHLGDHALQVALAGRRLGGGADDLLPDRRGAGEGDRVHARVGDEPRADLALAGQQRERVGGDARVAQRLDEHVGAARRLLGRLEHDGVAGGERGGGHPARDRDREVPRRDHRDDAARPVAAACCARPAPGAAPRRAASSTAPRA